MKRLTKKQKRLLWRIIAAGALFIICALLPLEGYAKGALFLLPYFTVGYDILKKAGLNILHGQIFDENFLMALATVGAFAIGEYPEAVFVMLFYQTGELFQSIAVGKSRRAITDLMDINPEFARVWRDGEYVEIAPEEITIGEKFLVKPGEKIAADGRLVSKSGVLDTSALTGESMPRDISEGDKVISGCICQSSPIEVICEKEYGQSTVTKILELVENSAASKAKTENFITRFARIYTPAVVIAALLTAFIPPLFVGNLTDWVMRALSFLVVSCPCALVISVPLAFFAGIGAEGAMGTLVKGSNYLEALARCETMVFDKTGTLTRGSFAVREVEPRGIMREEFLRLAAKCEAFSNHPIAVSLRNAYGGEVSLSDAEDVEEVPGRGVAATVEGKKILLGNGRMMKDAGIDAPEGEKSGSVIHMAVDGRYAGFALIADEVKKDAHVALESLKKAGVKKCVMLTGDTKGAAEAVGKKCGIDEVYSSLLPDGKVAMLKKIIDSSGKGTVVYVGDGVNDAPVLKLADAGVAMGAMGSDAAIEAADIVLMDDDVGKLPESLKTARKTLRKVRENIVFSLAVKIGVLALLFFGVSNMWQAVFADVGVMVVAVLNSMLINVRK